MNSAVARAANNRLGHPDDVVRWVGLENRTTGLSASLLRLGFVHGDRISPRSRARFQIEVHPHAASRAVKSISATETPLLIRELVTTPL